jgi:hypothetical protein
MKKIFTRIASASLLALLCCCFSNLNAQILNEPANWPNTDWSLTGTYATPVGALEADPTVSANFAYDDDDAGSGAINQIAAESPVYDLTAASTGGEEFLELSADYVYNNIGADFINVEWWDADAGAWQVWLTLDEDGASTPTDNFCTPAPSALDAPAISIAGFTANQLENFQYRINFDDGGVWAWGFCFSSPTLTSAAVATIEGCIDDTAANYDPVANTDDGSCFFVACADDTPLNETYCYGDNENGIFASYGSITLGEAVTIEIESGDLAFGDDLIIYDGLSNTDPVLLTLEGPIDVSGTVIEATGDFISLGVVSGGFTSCQSGAAAASDFVYNVYCGQVEVAGCTDDTAANYNPEATVDDGSCIVCAEGESYITIEVGGGSFASEVSWELQDEDGVVAISGGAPYEESQCIAEGCYQFEMFDSFGDSWNGNTYTIFDGAGEVLYTGTLTNDGPTNGSGPEINFTPIGGTVEELGCTIPGCTNEDAINYDENATEDDGSCVLPSENDECADATPVTCGDSLSGNTSAASAGLEADSAWSCNADIAPGNWYVFNGDGQVFTAATCGSATDTEITVFTIGDCGDIETYDCVGNNDDGCGLQSSITFPTTAGVDYYIHVGNFPGASGAYSVTFECSEPCTPEPANVDCANATFLLDSLEIAGSTNCAPPSSEVNPFCAPGGATVYGVWYEFTATESTYYIDVQNTGGAGNIGAAIYGAPAGDPDPCTAAISAGTLLCGFATDNVVGPLPFDLVPGDSYFVYVFSSGVDNTTDFTINTWAQVLGCTDPAAENYCPECNTDDGSCVPPDGFVPANDTCEAATALICGETVEGSVLGATATGAPAGCIATGAGVWYQVTGDDQLYTASLCGSDADTRISIYEGECGALTCLGSNAADPTPQDENECGFEFQDDGYIEWVGTAGENYYIYVESQSAATAFDLTLECEEAIVGCTNPAASNYDPTANVEDNTTCDFTFEEACDGTYTYCYEDNSAGTVITYNAANENDIVVITFNSGSVENIFDEIFIYDGENAGANVLNAGAPYGNVGDMTGLTYEATGSSISLEVQSDGIFSCATGEITPELNYTITCIPGGCTEPVACNYDPAAEIDSGNCEFDSCQGCTYPDATNYDELALIDDGSCEFDCSSTCPEDLTGDGIVQTDDLLQFLGAYGSTCPTVN